MTEKPAFDITIMIPGGIRPDDHVHLNFYDDTCSRCRKAIEEGDVPLMLWLNDGQDMLSYCAVCLGGVPVPNGGRLS